MNTRTSLALVLAPWSLPFAIGIIIAPMFIPPNPVEMRAADRGPGDAERPDVYLGPTDDTLRLCFGFPSRVRPTSCATAPGSGRTLFVYRRAYPERRGFRSAIRSALASLADAHAVQRPLSTVE